MDELSFNVYILLHDIQQRQLYDPLLIMEKNQRA